MLCRVDLVLRRDRDRAVQRRGRARTGPRPARSIAWLARAARREPVAHRRGLGAAPTRWSPRWPFGGFSWGEVGYAFHDIAPPRRGERRRRPARVVPRGRAQRVRSPISSRRAAGRRALRAAPRPGSRSIAAVVVDRRPSPAPSRTVVGQPARRARPGQRPGPRPHRRRDRRATTCPRSHFALAGADHRPGRPDRVPRVEHGHATARRRPPHRPVRPRATSTAIARQHARVGARQRDRRRPARRQQASRTSTCCSTRPARSSAPTRSATSCRSASTVPFRDVAAARRRIGARSRSRATSQPGRRPGPVHGRGRPHRHADLLRVGVRLPGAAAGARRRAGDRRLDEQPLLPAFGELRPARRDRPDARGRDRPAGGAGRDLGDHRGDRRRRRRARPHAPVRPTVVADDGRGDERRDAVRPLRRVGDVR